MRAYFWSSFIFFFQNYRMKVEKSPKSRSMIHFTDLTCLSYTKKHKYVWIMLMLFLKLPTIVLNQFYVYPLSYYPWGVFQQLQPPNSHIFVFLWVTEESQISKMNHKVNFRTFFTFHPINFEKRKWNYSRLSYSVDFPQLPKETQICVK